MNAEPVVRRTARALLLDDAGQLVLIRRTRPGCAPYWVTPGGGVEDTDATVEAALRRELREELGAEVTDVVEVAVLGGHHVHRARLIGMDLARRNGPELADPARGGYEVERVDPGVVAGLDLRPAELKEYLAR